MKKQSKAILMALLAAALFGISSPISKLLLTEVPPALMASLLYLGAGIGMLAVHAAEKLGKRERHEAGLTKEEMPYILGMVFLDIAAPLFLMMGLSRTTSANASLLGNFEIPATALIALLLFKESVGRKMWAAIGLITLACMLLTVESFGNITFSMGSVFILLACICWGFENNCTRKLSCKDPLQIVVIKGFGSGAGSLVIALFCEEFHAGFFWMVSALILGFLSYGLSIYFYIKAQRELGAAKTSAFYAASPFFGVLVSIFLFNRQINPSFSAALVLMAIGAYIAAKEEFTYDRQ